MINRKPSIRTAILGGSAMVLLAIAGCSDEGGDFDVSSQIGPDPVP